jgi:hypothetical protein
LCAKCIRQVRGYIEGDKPDDLDLIRPTTIPAKIK